MKIGNAATLVKSVDIKTESMKVVLGVLMLFAASQIAIPLEPVPITLQTVGVMLVAQLYSRRASITTMLLYTFLGGIGLPLFQGFEGGFEHLYGASAGYIFGFTAAAFVMSFVREKLGSTSFWAILANCIVGTLVVFLFGVSWLAAKIGLSDAITYGVMPFILPGVVKAVLLSGALRYVRHG